MRFLVRHTTRYSYQKRVVIEPLTVRLKPRIDAFQHLLSFRLQVTPEPAGRSESNDLDGNVTTSLWFQNTHDFLSLVSFSEVKTLRPNPFDFIMTPEHLYELPMTYLEETAPILEPYRKRETTGGVVDDLAEDVAAGSGRQTLPFLTDLCHWMKQEVVSINRRYGDPHPPAHTLALREGACRDVTLLFMDACRSQGLATRFVSGYCEPPDSGSHPELHAWAEVYIPGAGWRGFDPSLGLAVGDRHVAVAAGTDPVQAAPVSGTFCGPIQTSHLWYEVSIQVRPDDSGVASQPLEYL